jgi:hypothetical protein
MANSGERAIYRLLPTRFLSMFRRLLLQAYIECAAKCSGLRIRSAYPAIYVTGILARFVGDTLSLLHLEGGACTLMEN